MFFSQLSCRGLEYTVDPLLSSPLGGETVGLDNRRVQ